MKMKIYNFIILSIICSSCASSHKSPFNSNYFNDGRTVGLVIIVCPIEHDIMSNRYGILPSLTNIKTEEVNPYSMTPDSFYNVMRRIEANFDIKEKMTNYFLKLFSEKGKNIKPITESLDYEVFVDPKNYYKGTYKLKGLSPFLAASKDKKYYDYDLRYLKEKHQIDEVIIAFIRYGSDCIYRYRASGDFKGYSVFEIYCQTQVNPLIVDLKDNSVLNDYENIGATGIQFFDYEGIKDGIIFSTKLVLDVLSSFLFDSK